MRKTGWVIGLLAMVGVMQSAAASQPIIIPVPGGGDDGPIIIGVERIELHCSSSRYRYAECSVPGLAIKALVRRQVSRARCEEGKSFGTRGNVLWVHRGCRADFEVLVKTFGGAEVDEVEALEE